MKKFVKCVLVLAVVLPCAVLLFACKGKSAKPVQLVKTDIDVSGVCLAENSFVYDGSEKRAEISQSTLPENVEVEQISGGTATNAGSYSATIQLKYTGTNPEKYNEIPTITLDWAIEKATLDLDLSVIELEDSDFEYNKLARQVEVNQSTLPENVIVKQMSGNTATNAGSYTATIQLEYTGTDAQNYEELPEITLDWKIEQFRYSLDGAQISLKTNTLTYNGEKQTVELTSNTISYLSSLAGSGIIIGYAGFSATEEGNYTAKITFECEDKNNYELLNHFITRPWSIVAA